MRDARPIAPVSATRRRGVVLEKAWLRTRPNAIRHRHQVAPSRRPRAGQPTVICTVFAGEEPQTAYPTRARLRRVYLILARSYHVRSCGGPADHRAPADCEAGTGPELRRADRRESGPRNEYMRAYLVARGGGPPRPSLSRRMKSSSPRRQHAVSISAGMRPWRHWRLQRRAHAA